MKINDFDYHLPADRIARHPVAPRDSARMLVVSPETGLKDETVADLPEFLQPGDVAVFNDTKVIPAFLSGRRLPRTGEDKTASGGARVSLNLHAPLDGKASESRWRAFARPAKRLREGDHIVFDQELSARVIGREDGGEVLLDFGQSMAKMLSALARAGDMPIPPYLKRPPQARDRDDYQTIYARTEGAVAAPTAGLHFTQRLLDALDVRGVARVMVTLHVGAGTFQPVQGDLESHVMHTEYGVVSPQAAAAINEAKARGGRLLAVGTTSLRLLESAAGENGLIQPFTGETDLFIRPGYKFSAADLLLTNFHLPRSTLFVLVCAFSGFERMRAAYDHAVRAGYRFYSYGDCTLLHRDD